MLTSRLCNPQNVDVSTFVATTRLQNTYYCYVTVVSCNQPPWPKHGFVQCQSGEVLLGSTCTVMCQDGYELTGNPILKCVDENKFHASPPTCSCKRPENN